ncbi:hypothetical protein [Rhodococcus opacus]|uniref:hypothetical protein n=1 Tax=Rhodococcus opacus TaxID=37919 RepID=UPI00247CD1D9|nr:hypothetical protein [Rhodococcus opacus]
MTTPEQTVLDLARWPALGDAENEIPAAVTSLYRRSDRERLNTLAAEQGLTAALARAETWVQAAS